MKKILIALVITNFFLFSSAQEQSSKNNQFILPEKGDIAISIDASPFLDYVGNIIGGGNVAPTFNPLTGTTLVIKYFNSPNMAYRLGAGITHLSSSVSTLVPIIPAATPISYVEDIRKTSSSGITLTGGVEYRKGKSRLQGIYGVEAGLALMSNSNNYTYGNPISDKNPVSYVMSEKFGTIFGIGVRGFCGIEYFIFPKVSIGGEFGWGINYSSIGKGEGSVDSWNNAGRVITTTKVPIGGRSEFSANPDNDNSIFGPAGTLRLSFHL